MKLYKSFPKASDRMGMLWAANGINDGCIVEFGPAGTTHFSIEALMQFDTNITASTYTTHIDEHDVTFGSDERLIEAIKEVDEIDKPEVIFVFGSSVTSIIGIDLESVKLRLQNEVNAKLVIMEDCDFISDEYTGVEKFLVKLVNEVVEENPNVKKSHSYNILGTGIYRYNHISDMEEIKRLMKDYYGMEIHTTFTDDTTIDKIKTASMAKINLVVSEEGLKAAKILEQKFGQPYVQCLPIGIEATKKWVQTISEKLEISMPKDLYAEETERILYKEAQLKRHINTLKNKKIYVEDKSKFKEITEFLLNIGFELGEKEESHLLFADGIMFLKENNVIQIKHPSFITKSDYAQTPYVGIRGSHYLCQIIYNTLAKLQINSEK